MPLMNQIHDASAQDEIIHMSVIWHAKGCGVVDEKGYLLDMDGVIYRGGEVILGRWILFGDSERQIHPFYF